MKKRCVSEDMNVKSYSELKKMIITDKTNKFGFQAEKMPGENPRKQNLN